MPSIMSICGMHTIINHLLYAHHHEALVVCQPLLNTGGMPTIIKHCWNAHYY